ncbi:hypothetical protein ES708_33121 [subsurface metagenome]
MIRTYYLPVQIINGSEAVAGIQVIEGGLLLTTEAPDLRKLIMDTSDDQHAQLSAIALDWNEATPEELELFNSQVIITPPDPDTIRAEELLITSPAVITQPEMWELVRIFGRRLGYRF